MEFDVDQEHKAPTEFRKQEENSGHTSKEDENSDPITSSFTKLMKERGRVLLDSTIL
jgi:hypothetical protein